MTKQIRVKLSAHEGRTLDQERWVGGPGREGVEGVECVENGSTGLCRHQHLVAVGLEKTRARERGRTGKQVGTYMPTLRAYLRAYLPAAP
jgi:hypothetical protein